MTAVNYKAAMARVETWEREAGARARREAEAVVGMPYHGCVWHNARIAFEAGRPWEEIGPERVKAIKRYDWQQRVIWDTARRLRDAFWDRYCRLEFGFKWEAA